MIALYGRVSSEEITLQTALKECYSVFRNGSEAIALLYSPARCQFAKLQSDVTLKGSDEPSIDLTFVFEARVFNEHSELRWLNQSDGRGQAVIISERNLQSCLDKDVNLEAIATVDQHYLMWGEVIDTQSGDGWISLATSRIGTLDVPIYRVSGKRVKLKAVEYLKQDEYGNVAVVEERLVKLEQY